MEQLLLAMFVFAIALIALCQVVHPHPHHATQEKLYTAPVKNTVAVVQVPHNTNNVH